MEYAGRKHGWFDSLNKNSHTAIHPTKGQTILARNHHNTEDGHNHCQALKSVWLH